jgi:hypothetical protein
MTTASTVFAGKPHGKKQGVRCRLVFYLRQLPNSDQLESVS